MGALQKIMGYVSLDASGFETGAKRVESSAKRMSGNLSSGLAGAVAGIFTVGAITSLARETVDYAGKIADLKARLDVGAEALQGFGYAAKQNGAELATFVAFLEKLNLARAKALSGDSKALADFAKLGVSKDDLKTKRSEEITKQIAASVKNGDIQKLIAPLAAVGGKSAGDLVAAFKDGIEEKMDEARAAGLIIAEGTINELDAVGDQLDTLGTLMKSSLAPAIGFAAEKITTFIYMLKAEAARLGGYFGDKGALGAAKAFFRSGTIANAVNIGNKAIHRQMPTASDVGGLLKSLLPGSGIAAVIKDIANNDKATNAADEIYGDLATVLDRFTGRPQSKKAPTSFEETQKAEKQKPDQFATDKLATDSLTKMGGFVGGAETVLLSIQKETLKAAQQTARNTKVIADKMSGPSESIIE